MQPKNALKVAALIALAVIALTGLLYWRYLSIALPPVPDLSGRFGAAKLDHDGRRRTYGIYVPVKLREHPALILALHGSQGSGERMRRGFAWQLDVVADQRGWLVAYPDGFEGHWNGCRRAGPYSANTLAIDDVGFLRALAGSVVAEHGADPQQVFATGFSNGGHMAIRLALEAPDLVRAVAPIAASLPAGDNLDCTNSRQPVAFMIINGSDDPINPFAGGEVSVFGYGKRGRVHSSRDTALFWVAQNGHQGTPSISALADGNRDDASTVHIEAWRAADKPAVAHYEVRGGGHTIPSTTSRMPRILGNTNTDFSAAEEIAEFFAATASGETVRR